MEFCLVYIFFCLFFKRLQSTSTILDSNFKQFSWSTWYFLIHMLNKKLQSWLKQTRKYDWLVKSLKSSYFMSYCGNESDVRLNYHNNCSNDHEKTNLRFWGDDDDISIHIHHYNKVTICEYNNRNHFECHSITQLYPGLFINYGVWMSFSDISKNQLMAIIIYSNPINCGL